MPTLLAAHGLSIPTDVDGKVLPLVSETNGTQEPIKHSTTGKNDAGDEVENRLKQLGYME
jgi:hypothetical protein